jgi:hypothetical protein
MNRTASIAEVLTPIVLWATTIVMIVHNESALPVALSAGSAGMVSGAYFARWIHRRAQAEHDERLLDQILNELETR